MSRKEENWVVCTCRCCWEPFEMYYTQVKRGKGKYCGQECYVDSKTVVCTCQFCWEPFEIKHYRVTRGGGIFCSQGCARQGSKVEIAWTTSTCRFCQKAFKILHTRIADGKGQFCSKTCQQEAGRVIHVCRECKKQFETRRSVKQFIKDNR